MKVFLEGVEMSALQSATEKALYFFAYTGLKNVYRHCTSPRDSVNGGTTPAAAPPTNNTMTLLILGCCAEWAHLPVTLPLDCWTTAIQTNQDPTKKPMQLLLTMLSDKVRRLLCWFGANVAITTLGARIRLCTFGVCFGGLGLSLTHINFV